MRSTIVLVCSLAGCGTLLSVDDPKQGTLDGGTTESRTEDRDSGSGTSSGSTSSGGVGTVDGGNTEDSGCTPIEHYNGVGQVYLSCAPLGTWDEASAWAACKAYVAGGTGGSCHLRSGGTCVGKAIVSVGMLVRDETNAAWDFGAGARGHVSTYPNAAPIGCPSTTDPVWQ